MALTGADRGTIGRVLTVTALAALGLPGCSHAPTSPAGAVTLVGASPATPANNAQINYYTQPVTLSVTNGGSADPALAVTDTFQVATDATFTAIIASVEVPQAAGARTTTMLPALAPNARYFWRVGSTAGAVTSPFSAPLTFTIGPRVVFGAPTLLQPLAGTFVTLRPTMVVTNATRTGPAGTIVYRFDVSTSSTFGTITATGTVPEGAGQTSFTPTADLSAATGYFWRVQVIDSTNHENGPVTGGAFVTPVVGAATLTLHNPTSCYTFASDIAFAGSVTVNTGGLSFQSTYGPLLGSTPLGLVWLVGESGTIQGDAQGAAEGQLSASVPFGLLVELKFEAPAALSGVSFGPPGKIAGTFSGAFRTWNPFSDGGTLCSSATFTWQIVPR
jgi:hypothetical protein